jgi:hypothetical protein
MGRTDIMNIAYEQGTPEGWDAGLTKLAVDREGKDKMRIAGPCPRCGHPIEKVMGGISVLFGQELQRQEALRVRIVCNCTEQHPNTPEGRHGCGAEGVASVRI